MKKNIKWFLSKISRQDEDFFTWGDFFSNILMFGCMAFMFLIFPLLCFMKYDIVVAGVAAGVQWSAIGIALLLFTWSHNRYMNKIRSYSPITSPISPTTSPESKPKPITNDTKDIDKEKDTTIYASIVEVLREELKENEPIDFMVADRIYDDIVNAIGIEKARRIFMYNYNIDTNNTNTDTDTDTDTDTNTDNTDAEIKLTGLSFINKQFVEECLTNKRQNSFQHAVAADGTDGFWYPTECKYIDYSKVYTSDKHKLCTRDAILLMIIKLISNGYYKEHERIFNPKFLRDELGIRSDVAKEVFDALLDASIINRHFKDYYVLKSNADTWYCSYKLRNLYKFGYLSHREYKGKDTKWHSNYKFK